MNTNDIKNILIKHLSLQEVHVYMYNNHCHIIAIDRIFANINTIKQHKIIYAPLQEHILNNSIHSISMKTFSPEEWDKEKNIDKTT